MISTDADLRLTSPWLISTCAHFFSNGMYFLSLSTLIKVRVSIDSIVVVE
jgi:hypothetical protein